MSGDEEDFMDVGAGQHNGTDRVIKNYQSLTKISILNFKMFTDVPTLGEQAMELRRLSDEFKGFRAEYAERKKQDTYRFAEIAENEDYNRVMITGNRGVYFNRKI